MNIARDTRECAEKLLFESEYSSELQKEYGTTEASVVLLGLHLDQTAKKIIEESREESLKLSRECLRSLISATAKKHVKEDEQHLKKTTAEAKAKDEYYEMVASANSK